MSWSSLPNDLSTTARMWHRNSTTIDAAPNKAPNFVSKASALVKAMKSGVRAEAFGTVAMAEILSRQERKVVVRKD
jgi:hypothetical protein